MANTILLADDSVTIQKVVELTFMEEDFEVVAVSSGDEAVSRLEGVDPTLVIADVHMPGVDGYEVCRRVKEQRPDIPVLLLVGTFEPFQEEEARAAGADGHLKKPFDSQELLRRVQELVEAEPEEGEEEGAPWQEPPAEEVQAEGEAEPLTAEAEDGEVEELAEEVWEPAEVEPRAEPVGTEVVEAEELEVEELEVEELDEGSAVLELEDEGYIEPTEAPPLPLMGEVAPEGAEEPTEPLSAEELGVGAAEEEAAWTEVEAEEEAVAEPPPVPPEVAGAEEEVEAEPATPPAPPVAAAEPLRLSDEDVERIARRVVELMSESVLREVAWELVPDLAELVIKDRIQELEAQVE